MINKRNLDIIYQLDLSTNQTEQKLKRKYSGNSIIFFAMHLEI
jgi:hypothetical protein